MAYTSSSVTASPSTQEWTYDVFLSFRGPDTRKTFIDYLYKFLENKGIRTFKDDNRMEKGDCISESLINGIRASKFFIPVFSVGYASSKWCLEELATVIECQKNLEQIVVPIFHHVEPSDVRKQEGSFGDSFKELTEKFGTNDEEKVRRWKEALKKAGELKGHHLQNDYNGYEATCAEMVATDINAKLYEAVLPFEEKFVGLESRVNNIGNWLRLASDDNDDDVRFIGICGMGGIGKTTIATIVYRRFSRLFDVACFLADVRKHNNVIELQKALLRKILKEKSRVEIEDVQDGKANIRKRLQGKKVLIVLDDVDDPLEQLDNLVGGSHWFGRGSRVIITTRDAGVLRSHGVDDKYIYQVDILKEQEAIQLFRLYAFKKEPKTGVEELCGSVVRYCEGLPLALKLLGSHLCSKSAANWETILEKLEDATSLHAPKDKILNVLRISFDVLDPDNKNAFLDITCFFRNWREEYVKGVLNSDLCELIEKSLISVQNGRIEMHDRIQEMGRYIASQEKPWRLWQLKDAVNVLSGNMDHKDIEGISWFVRWLGEVSSWGNNPVEISFREMINLKMFKVDGYGNRFHVTDNDLPSSLRWLEIQFYPFASLPESFASSELVGLSLRNSSLQNWRITQILDKLTLLDLSSSSSLLETPNFDWMPNLRRLNLQYCGNLRVVHPSIGNLSKLVLLDLSDCSNLESIPSFNQVSSLKSLGLCGCEELKFFPEINAGIPHLVELDLVCVGIIELPSSIEQLHGLTKLGLYDCEHLECLCDELCELEKLKVLVISHCTNLKSLPENLQDLISLEYLNLNGSYFDSLPESFTQLPRLGHLDIRSCSELEVLPKLPKSLRQLYADPSFAFNGNIAGAAKKCSELHSLAFSIHEERWPGRFLAEMCNRFPFQRTTPSSVNFPVSSEVHHITGGNALRLYQYRCYDSNGISISFQYCKSFVGFAVYFFSSEYDVWERHYGRDIDDAHCTVIAKLSHTDNGIEVLERECVIVKPDEEDYTDIEGDMCFLYIPFSSLWPAAESNTNINSISPNYNLRFEVNFMNSKATTNWGCSLLYERSNRPASWDYSRPAGCATDIGPLGMLEYLNLTQKRFEQFSPEDISRLRHIKYLDISGCGKFENLPELPATIVELYANTYLLSESNIVELASRYSELYSVSFSEPNDDYPVRTIVPRELAENFIPITESFLNRNTPFAVTYPFYAKGQKDRFYISKCFRYPHNDPHHDPHKISVSLDPNWYNHNFVGFVVCFIFPREVRWESCPDIRPFRSCQLITKLTHKDNGSEPPLQTECVIGRLYDEEFDEGFYEEDIVCFVYIPFSSLWPKSKAITDNTTPNHYLVFEEAIQELEFSKTFYDENYMENSTEWSCGLLYADDESLIEAIRRKREVGSFNSEAAGSSENDSGPNRTELLKIVEIVDEAQCQMVSMPECFDTKVTRLLYTNSGVGILALSSNGIQKLWKWPKNEQNPTGKATANSAPEHWQPNSGLMINDVGVNLKKVVSCIDLSKNDSYIVLAAGKKVSLLDIMTFEVLTTFSPPSTPTFLVFYPCDNDIIAVGMDDGTIIIYNVRLNKVKTRLIKGHYEHITGLAFSTTGPNMLVSSSADAQLCVWNIVGRKQNRRPVYLQSPDGEELCSGDTHVMFHTVQLHLLLVTHETQLAIYDTSNMECKRQWIVPQGCLSAPISFATYSCNSELVYASFNDGNIGVLDADNLTLRCCIVPSAYLSQPQLNSEDVVYAVVIAAHPQEPNQLAIGLTDGSIKVIEPLESEGEWGMSPPIDIEILNGKEGEDEGRGKSLDAGQGIEVGMSKHIDSVNEKEKEREDEQRKKDLLNNDKTLSSSKQHKKIRDDELSVTDIQPPIVGNNASKNLWDNFINSLAAFLPDKDYIELEIDQALFHHTNTRSIVVMIEDIKDLMRMECLDVSIIKLFILFLNKLCNQLQVTSIGFVCPAQISMDMAKQNAPDVTSYFINVMEHHKNKQFILAPYNQKFHWLLLVICIRSRSLYVLDPLPCDRIIEIKEILNTAFDSVSTNGSVNWKQCKCPIQLGGVECGYYVMRYMFDIVTKYSSVDCLDEAFESNIQYSINEINEIRDLWAKYFLEECRQTEEGSSVSTQLDLVTGEAEHSEQTPVDEDCEAEVEANQGIGSKTEGDEDEDEDEDEYEDEDEDEEGDGDGDGDGEEEEEDEEDGGSKHTEDSGGDGAMAKGNSNSGTGEAEQGEPNPANEDCDEAAQKSVLTQLEHDIGEAEHSEQTPVDEDCEAEVEANQCAIICRFWQFGLTDGSVKVIEPLESIGNWEVSPPINNDEILNGQPLAQPPATMCRQQTKLGDETECILILMVFLCCFFAYKHLRINLDASYQGDEMHCIFMLAVFFCIFIGICFRFLVVFSGG